MKTRRHHNNKGLTQCKRGTPAKRTKRLAKRLGIPFSPSSILPHETH